MQRLTLTLLLLLYFFSWSRAAPKLFSCISYMDDDKFLQDDDSDDFDEYPVGSNAVQNAADMDGAATATDLADNTQIRHRKICPLDYTFCFSLWRQTENGTHFEKQGCWKESTERNATCSQKECTSSAPTSRNNSLYYCCCSGEICNQNVSVVEPATLQLSRKVLTDAANLENTQDDSNFFCSSTLIWCFVAVVAVLISASASFYYYRNGKEKPEPEEAPLAPSGPGYSSNLRNVDNMNLICMLGSGKYGTVMKGLLHDQEVAVKIFPEAHHQYYINERNIYSLPMMDCPALLTYFGYDERHTMEGKVEYQLVLSLASLGCLADWLIANTMDFETFCGMSKSITRGLSHLHTELRRGDEQKPCIAHRDLNSRNILVKADRTCCIADFGFALKVFGSKYEYKGEIAMAETKSINEVGTLRYMAPELLEGAVNLRDCETSLKQMDVYALGLVLWEVATRCVDFYPPAQMTPPYKAPYELEVGTHPSFDQMQALVVRHKARPLFPAGWGGGAAAKLVKDTCEDCWDHDAEARLTSLCAEERMHEVASLRPRLHPHAQSASPLLSANNLTGDDTNPHHQNILARTSNISNEAAAAAACHTETTTMLNPPPNQRVIPQLRSTTINIDTAAIAPQTEKNHLIYSQQQPLQPYQGRNPCQERNLAPIATRTPQILVEKSKKHSFQTGQENSFSCLEDDVSVEDLISSSSSKKFATLTTDASSMGQGFPKQHNTDKKLRGWHGVRALIQKKLFRKDDNADVFRQLSYGDEKSNLVDNRYAAVVKNLENGVNGATAKSASISFIDDRQRSPNGVAATRTIALDAGLYAGHQQQQRRPNNLDLSPITQNSSAPMLPPAPASAPAAAAAVVITATPQQNNKTNFMNSIAEEAVNGNLHRQPQPTLQSIDTRISTPSHVVPRSLSTSLIKHNNNNINYNNNNCKTELKTLAATQLKTNEVLANATSKQTTSIITITEPQFRRQRSLEVFREVFSGRGSTDKLRDPSQRVKTPGDVPPSVRKVRASKTLSLYDDRMMDSSTLNIL